MIIFLYHFTVIKIARSTSSKLTNLRKSWRLLTKVVIIKVWHEGGLTGNRMVLDLDYGGGFRNLDM